MADDLRAEINRLYGRAKNADTDWESLRIARRHELVAALGSILGLDEESSLATARAERVALERDQYARRAAKVEAERDELAEHISRVRALAESMRGSGEYGGFTAAERAMLRYAADRITAALDGGEVATDG